MSDVLSSLPPYWWRDRAYAEPVQAKIRELLREGYSTGDVARRTGVGSRTVSRYRAKATEPAGLGHPERNPA